MTYSKNVAKSNRNLMTKTEMLALLLQQNLNDRLDGLIFRAVESESAFNSERPHDDNVISIVQVNSAEINLYKGDTRITLGGGTIIDHAILIGR